MEKHWVEEIFEKCGAILEGHFALTSGKHSGNYLDKTLIYPNTQRISELCWNGIDHKVYPFRIEAVVGPAHGGIIMSHLVADSITSHGAGRAIALYTEKDEKGKQVLSKAYWNLLSGKRVAVVDDILTTGGSVKQVIQEVERAGGQVVVVAVICNRGGVTQEDIGGYPLFWLWEVKLESWLPEDCPLCKEGKIPLTNLKSR